MLSQKRRVSYDTCRFNFFVFFLFFSDYILKRSKIFSQDVKILCEYDTILLQVSAKVRCKKSYDMLQCF